MSENYEKNGWNEWSKHIIRELERLNQNSERVREDLQKSNIEISKLQGFHKDIAELKHNAQILKGEIEKNSYRWQEDINSKIKELIQDFSESLKGIKKENATMAMRISELEGQKKYIRGIMVAIVFIITTLIAVLSLFDWGSIGS